MSMETKIKKAKAPRCRKCNYPEQDDPERIFLTYRYPENGRLRIRVHCPNVQTPFGKRCITEFEPPVVRELIFRNPEQSPEEFGSKGGCTPVC